MLDNKIIRNTVIGGSFAGMCFLFYFKFLKKKENNDNHEESNDEKITNDDLIEFYNDKIKEIENSENEDKEILERTKQDYESSQEAENNNNSENNIFDQIQLDNKRDLVIKKKKLLKNKQKKNKIAIQELKDKIQELQENKLTK